MAGVALLVLSSLTGGLHAPCLPSGPTSAQARVPSPCQGTSPGVSISCRIEAVPAIDLAGLDPEQQADGPAQSEYGYITMDGLAAAGLYPTLVPVTGTDPALRAVSSP